MADPSLSVRVSDADRNQAVAILRDNAGRGTLTMTELEERLAIAMNACTVGDLAAATWDLVRPDPAPPVRHSVWQASGFVYHAAAYGLVNAMLVGTWWLTGHGFFWPFFPIAGWGVGLGMHSMAAPHSPSPEKPPALHRQGAVAAPPTPVLTEGGPAPALGGAGPLAGQEPSRAVRYVVVMFADIANSTALNEALGDGDWAVVRSRHLQMVRSSVTDHGGTEVSCLGDGVFVRFGDSPAAVACAVEIQRRIDAAKAEVGFAPRVRIGIHAGEAVEEGADLIGSAINLAARVAAEAAPDQILITEPVADLLGSGIDIEDFGMRTLKGISRPRHLLAVCW